jgi:hypothetical protein
MPDTKKSATPTKGWTDEERAAMKEHAKELKAAAKRGAAKEEGEADVRAKIAEMPGSDRAMAERIHELVKANAPDLTARTGTECLRMPRTTRSSASSSPRISGSRATRLSASTTARTSTRAHVADLLGSDGAERRRREEHRRACEEGGELRSSPQSGGMAVLGSRIGPLTDESSPGEAGELGSPSWGGLADLPTGGDDAGGRMMKQAGPAFRWLACAAVGLRVVLA